MIHFWHRYSIWVGSGIWRRVSRGRQRQFEMRYCMKCGRSQIRLSADAVKSEEEVP